MLLWQVTSTAGSVRNFTIVHWILVFLATPTRITDKTSFNALEQLHLRLPAQDAKKFST